VWLLKLDQPLILGVLPPRRQSVARDVKQHVMAAHLLHRHAPHRTDAGRTRAQRSGAASAVLHFSLGMLQRIDVTSLIARHQRPCPRR